MEINANKSGQRTRNPHVLLGFTNFRHGIQHHGASIFGSFHINAPLLWKSMQTNRARFHRTLDFIGFFAFHTATNIGGGCIFGSRQPSLRKDRACPRYRVAPLARQSLTRFENIKSLSSCFKRGRRIARITRADVVRMQGSRRKPSTKIPFARFAFPLRSLRYCSGNERG